MSKLLGRGEMNLELEDLMNLDSELLRSQNSTSLIKEPKSPVLNESPLISRAPNRSQVRQDELIMSGLASQSKGTLEISEPNLLKSIEPQ